MNYVLMYTTTLAVSLAFTLILFLYHMRYWDPMTHVPLRNIYILNMLSATMCIIWCVTDGKPEYSYINYLANIIEFNCMGFAGYSWLRYCISYLDIPVLKTKTAKLIMALPVLVVMSMIISTPWTHWAFLIDEAGYFQRGTIYFIQQTGYVYLIVSTVLTIWYRKRCKTSREKRHMTVLSMFPLSPAIFGSIQIIAPSGLAPTLQFSITISLILVFVDELDQKITRDSLTQLTNHYEFERILQNKMHGIQQKYGTKLYVMMGDLDDFKSINDNFGHQMGDEALKLVARVLNNTATKHGATCARMSGDEFLSFLEAPSLKEAESYRNEFEENLKAECTHLPFHLGMSIGIAEYDEKMSLMELIGKADKNMYKSKRQRKRLKA